MEEGREREGGEGERGRDGRVSGSYTALSRVSTYQS
jgi:hypothetical protein